MSLNQGKVIHTGIRNKDNTKQTRPEQEISAAHHRETLSLSNKVNKWKAAREKKTPQNNKTSWKSHIKENPSDENLRLHWKL